MKKSVRETGVNYGGLFRCCVKSLNDQLDFDACCEVGDTVVTECCNQTVELQPGFIWRWKKSTR